MKARFAFVIGRTVLVALALLALAGSVPSGSAHLRHPHDTRPNLILITVDSLRADHLGLYGYPRPTSPGLDAFAREAVVVSDGVAQAPYTKASIATLFTGLFPTTHKTYTTSVALETLQRTGSVGSIGPSGLKYTDVLSPDLPSLPVALRAAGYYTIGLSANPFLIPDFGFANGFVQFKYIRGESEAYARADRMLDEAADAVARAPQPYFLWVHLMDSHNPYEPPEAYRALLPPLTPPRLVPLEQIPEILRLGDVADVNVYAARYDAGIRAADAALAEFFGQLRASRQWDQTGIVLTADHGEGFMEHGLMSHNNSLYDELLRVPLVVKLPGLRPGRVRAQVQLADLFPTLAHVAGAAVPPRLHGQDAWGVLQGTGSAEPYAYAELVGVRFALRSLDWKLVASFQGGRQLFHLARDPGEADNLAPTDVVQRDKYERLLARALAMAVKDGEQVESRPVLIPPAVLERLRALGYVTK